MAVPCQHAAIYAMHRSKLMYAGGLLRAGLLALDVHFVSPLPVAHAACPPRYWGSPPPHWRRHGGTQY